MVVTGRGFDDRRRPSTTGNMQARGRGRHADDAERLDAAL